MLRRIESQTAEEGGHHPSRHRWDLYVCQEDTPEQRERLESHLQTCADCKVRLEDLQAERATFVARANPAVFLAGLEAYTARSQAETKPWWSRWLQWNPSWTLLPVGGLALFALFWGLQPQNPTPNAPLPTLTPQAQPLVSGIRRKGRATPVLQVRLHRAGVQHTPTTQTRYQAGDQLSFDYVSKQTPHLVMVLVDQKGKASWLYPARPGSSIPLKAAGTLPGGIQLDRARGVEQLWVWFSQQPLSAQQIRDQLNAKTQRTGWLNTTANKGNTVFVQRIAIQKTP